MGKMIILLAFLGCAPMSYEMGNATCYKEFGFNKPLQCIPHTAPTSAPDGGPLGSQAQSRN